MIKHIPKLHISCQKKVPVYPEIRGDDSKSSIEGVEQEGQEGQPGVQPCGRVEHFTPEEHRDGEEEVQLLPLADGGGGEGLCG